MSLVSRAAGMRRMPAESVSVSVPPLVFYEVSG